MLLSFPRAEALQKLFDAVATGGDLSVIQALIREAANTAGWGGEWEAKRVEEEIEGMEQTNRLEQE